MSTIERPPLSLTVAPLGENIRAVLDRIAQTPIRYVQLSAAQPGTRPRDLDQSARRDLVATLRRMELSCSGIDLWIPAAHFGDTATIGRAVDAMIAAIQLAGDLGRCPLSCGLPRSEAGDAGEESAHVRDTIESIIEAAERFGVPLADHALPPIDREGVGIGVDPAAILAAGNDPAQFVARHAGGIISARLCDLLTTGMRGPVGDSEQQRLDVLSYRAALNVADYRNPVVIDARQWAEPWQGVAQSAAAWQQAGW